MAISLENASVLTLGTGRSALQTQQIIIADGAIAYVGAKRSKHPFKIDHRIDCSGKIVMPGLVNAHCHLTEILQKSFREGLRMETWRDYRSLTEEMARLSPEEIEAAAQLACGELLKNGVTAVVDHFSTRPGLTLPNMKAILRGFAKTGIRGVLAASLRDQDPLSLIKSRASKPRALPAQARDRSEPLATIRSLLETHEFSPTSAIMLAPASPQTCSDVLIRKIVAMAEQHNLGIHTHLNETRLGRWIGYRLNRSGYLRHLGKLGFLSERLSTAHCVWLDDRDMDLLASSGVSAVHCPASNLKLGSGIAPIIELKKRGMNVALGTDGGDTSDSYSIFDQMRLAALLSRMTAYDSERWITALDALQMATVGGAQAIPAWRGKIGRIRPGFRADLLILKPHIRLRPLNDIVRQLVFCEGGHSVDTVIVDGNIVVKAGVLRRVREDRLIERVEAVSRKLYKLHARLARSSVPNQLVVDSLYRKIARHPILATLRRDALAHSMPARAKHRRHRRQATTKTSSRSS